jgi:PAS domain S-box-containing protein
MYILQAQDLEAKGIKYDSVSELIFRSKLLLRGTAFPTMHRHLAVEACKSNLQSGIFSILVEGQGILTLWSEQAGIQSVVNEISVLPKITTEIAPPSQPLSPARVSQPQKVVTYRGRVVSGGKAVSQGKPAVSQGKPAVSQGKPAVSQGKPAVSQGKPAVSNLLNRLFRASSPEGPTYRGAKMTTSSSPVGESHSDPYRSFFENASEPLFQAKPDGQFLMVNHSLATLLGYARPEELIQLPPEKIYANFERLKELLYLLQKQDTVSDFETQLYRQNGSQIRIIQDVRAVRDKRNMLIRYEGSFKEVTRPLGEAIILGNRYLLHHPIGSGGFGQTYLAEDTHRPNNPKCVVKKLSTSKKDPEFLEMARRLFNSEAEILERIGKHDQIPQLLAYFEQEGTFYLVQELIEGHSLSDEIQPGKRLSEGKTVSILQEVLQILAFVHSQNVIHRDIKPSNIIRRERDNRLVLIDFGAVKQFSTGLAGSSGNPTMAVGTPGYMPLEQTAGRPRFASDIYAVGILGIQALTGVDPGKIDRDPKTDELIWSNNFQLTEGLVNVINKMVRYHFAARYQTAVEALSDLLTCGVASSYT